MRYIIQQSSTLQRILLFLFLAMGTAGTAVAQTEAIKIKRVEKELVATVDGTATCTNWQWECWKDVEVDDGEGNITTEKQWVTIDGATTSTLTIGDIFQMETNPDDNNQYNKYRVTCSDGTNTLEGTWTLNMVFVYDKDASDGTTTNVNNTNISNYSSRYTSLLAKYTEGGKDTNTGTTPEIPVKNVSQAYKNLDAINSTLDGSKENVIIIMGFSTENTYWKDIEKDNKTYMRQDVTIAGAYGDHIRNGMIFIKTSEDDVRAIGGCTVLRDITFFGANQKMLLYCNLHDLTLERGIKIEKPLTLTDGGIISGTKSPNFTIIGGEHDYNGTGNADGRWRIELDNPYSGNADPRCVTITIKSGCIGRIIASGRNNNKNKNSGNVYGTVNKPCRAVVNIDIEPGNEITSGMSNYDIGMLVGGQTDGSTYAETVLNIKNGKIGRVVTGNITFCRVATDAPNDSFFGSNTVNVLGGKIKELMGGNLGRTGGDAGTCDAYYYGRSIINIKGGEVESNIYGAGARGVMGLGEDGNNNNHTSDSFIPYLDNNGDIKYGNYKRLKRKCPR